YERALMTLPPDSISAALPALAAGYAPYLAGADLNDTLNVLQLQAFVQDPWVRETYKAVEACYGDGRGLADELGTLFARAQALFPDWRAPQVYTYISGLDYPHRVVYADSVLSLGLDLYLPDRAAQYREAGFPNYIAQRMGPSALPVEVAQAVAVDRLPSRTAAGDGVSSAGDARGLTRMGTLLDEAVYQGKILCIVDRLLPDTDERQKLFYDEAQWRWCKENEAALWHHWMKEQLLYETDLNRTKHYINDGPANLAFQGAPPRLVQYVGWRIVSRYLQRVPADDPELWTRPAQEVLRISGYKP
ncbi:MAG: hypothetical protein K2O01_06335, partial [Bacteroidales bacterium]|nr:hypothetical protein [Bacteroidales bacterium]